MFVKILGLMPVIAACAFGASFYSVAVIPPPDGWTQIAMYGMNSSGQVAGSGYNGATFQSFIGSASGSTPVPLVSGGQSAYAEAINESGEVAGFFNGAGFQQGFVGTSSSSTAIVTPSGWNSAFPNSINNLGHLTGIVDRAETSGAVIQAFVGPPSNLSVVPSPASTANVYGYGINNLDQIVGLAFVPGGSTVPFIGTAAGSMVIPLPTGWTDGGAYAINDSGQVVGAVDQGSGSAPEQAFIWDSSGMTLIPLPAGAVQAAAGGVNNSGTVVGTAIANGPSGLYYLGGWIWDSVNGVRLLGQLVPTGWTITQAFAISATGNILAQALENGSDEFVELTPINASVFSLTIQTSPAGLQFSLDSGAVQVAPQTFTVPAGSTHTVSVVPTQPGPAGVQYVFASWSDGGAASHSVTVSGTGTYTASFQPQYQLTTSAGAGGTVMPASGQYYAAGTAVPISALPNAGYVFANWTGNVASANSSATTVTMSAPEQVTANFVAAPPVPVGFTTSPEGLQFSVDGGPVQTSPEILNLSIGVHTIFVAAIQTGAPGSQYVFTSWSDGGAASHVITVNSTTNTYTATFKTQYQLTVSSSPPAGGVVAPAGSGFYDSGSTVPISVTPNSGYAFKAWIGSVANPSSPSTAVTMNAAQNVTASLVSTTPAISAGGIVPVYSTVSVIQPGSWISIYGSNLANGSSVWDGSFPTSLGGVTVTIDNKPGYLWLVSPGQINLQAPDDSFTGPVSVIVKTPNGTATSTVTLAEVGPSFSLLDAKHVAAAILTPDGSGAYGNGAYDLAGPSGLFTFSTRPVRAGETLVLFGVGFGPTNPFVPAGAVFNSSAPTTNAVSISIGGVAALVQFSGITSAGLYQFNVTVPSTASGDQILQARVAEVLSPGGVYVTVQ